MRVLENSIHVEFLALTQVYLMGFCDDFFGTEFAAKTSEDYDCPMNAFDAWLKEQSSSTSPTDAFLYNCAGATELPVPQKNFSPCVIAWSKLANETHLLQNGGKVKILVNLFQSRVRYDSPYDVLKGEWNAIESWMNNQSDIAPLGLRNMYFSSEDFW